MQSEPPFHFHECGSGDPVVLLHGLMASSRVFDELIDAGRADKRFLSIDLPHSGLSGGWAAMTPEALATRLDEWLKARDIERAVVVGHSFGGLVALALAARQPRRVRRLILASAPALGLPAEMKQLLKFPGLDQGAALVGQFPMLRPLVRQYVKWLFGTRTPLTDRHLEGYVQALSNPKVWPGMLEAVRAIAEFRLPAETIVNARTEVEVLWGERDRLVPLVQGERLARTLGGRFRVLEHVGHCVPEEDAGSLLRAISG